MKAVGLRKLWAILVLLTLTLVVLWTPSSNREPQVNGKPPSHLTRQLRPGAYDIDLMHQLRLHREQTVPVLVRQMSIRDSPIKEVVRSVWLKLPQKMRARVPEPISPANLRAGAAKGLLMLWNPEVDASAPAPTPAEADLVLPALRAALKDKNHFVRLNAAAALGNFQARAAEAIAACAVAMQDQHWGVRDNAVYSLARLAAVDSDAVRSLRQALDDPRPEVRKRAREALDGLSRTLPVAAAPQ